MAGSATMPGGYVRQGGYLWDPWFVWVGESLHLFHLYQPAPPRYDPERGFARDRPVIAHATWSADTGWQPRSIAIDYTGTEYDAARIHTGCIVRHADQWWMFYSGSRRHVCLATSDDLETWRKHPDNPILTPDPRLYGPHWRDPWIYRDPGDGQYVMLLAAQRPHGGAGEAGVVGVARSRDLLRWDQHPPLDTPLGFIWLEVPEVHRIDGLWYLLFATQSRWIEAAGRERLRAQGVAVGTGAYCLVADNWHGPYRRIQRLFPVDAPHYTTRLVTTPRGEHWLWSHGEWVDDGERRFALLPPVACAVSEDGDLVGLQITETSN